MRVGAVLQVVLDKCSRLAHQLLVGKELGERAFRDREIDLPVVKRRVIFFHNVNQAQTVGLLVDDREAHGVGGAGGGEVLAHAAGVAAIAQLALMPFGWGEGRAGRMRLAEAEPRVTQRKPGGMCPGARFERPLGSEKRTGHAGILTERYANKLEASRIDILKQLLEQNPASTFARYGLAMEYVKAGELEAALVEFKAIAAADPAYSAAFFQGGQALEKLGRLHDARGFYREGIATTRDQHARSEMQAALDALGPDD